MLKNIYEILQEFDKAKTEIDKRRVLVNNRSETLITFFQLAFDPRVKFVIKEIPERHLNFLPVGMGYTNMGNAIKKTYLFIEGHPRRPLLLEGKKQDNLLLGILESLEDREAGLYIQMLQKKVKVKGLTPALLEKTFPNIFTIPIRA